MNKMSILFLLAGIALFGVGHASSLPTGATKNGKILAREGVMSEQDYYRLFHITDGASKSHRISDSDLKWCIDLLTAKPPKVNRYTTFQRPSVILTYLSTIWYMNRSQRIKWGRALKPYLALDRLANLARDDLKRIDAHM